MMKGIFAAGLLVFGGAVQAATVDLTDGAFSAVSYETFVQGAIGPIVAFSETVDGVTFAFERTSGQFRRIGPWGDGNFDNPPFELDLGGGGGSASGFSLVVSHDVTLNTFSGMAQQFVTAPTFDVTGSGVSSLGNAFSVSGFVGSDLPGTDGFVGGALNLVAGENYQFTVTNAGAATLGFFTGFEFTAAPVPLPSALALLLPVAMGVVRVRRSA